MPATARRPIFTRPRSRRLASHRPAVLLRYQLGNGPEVAVFTNLRPVGKNAVCILLFVNAMYLADVVIKVGRGLRDAVEVGCPEERPLEILAEPAFVKVPSGKRDGGLECVLYLPAVPPSRRLALGPLPMLVDEAPDLILVDVDVNVTSLQARNVVLPDLFGGGLAELWVVETDMDSGSERFVEFADPVSREDNDARVVFQDTQEDLNSG